VRSGLCAVSMLGAHGRSSGTSADCVKRAVFAPAGDERSALAVYSSNAGVTRDRGACCVDADSIEMSDDGST
jgi:hypothetical protein